MIRMLPSTHDEYPKIPDVYAIFALVLTFLITAYSTRLGFAAILVLYGLWFPFIYYKQRFALFPLKTIMLPTIFCAYCFFSAIWSDYISITLYAATQYATTVVCAIIIARVVPLDTFMKGLALGCFFVLLPLFHTGSFSFYGLFGSKNMVGLYAQVGILASLLVFLVTEKDNHKTLLFFVLMPALLSAICLILSHSATSIISTILVLFVFLGSYFLGRMNQAIRPLIAFLALFFVLVCGMLIYAFRIDVLGEILELAGKDRTLTGRTEIWQAGIEAALHQPILGTGYGAFWVPGQPVAEEIWDKFFISGKTGFHFHNLFIQAYTELGLIGVALMIIMVMVYILKSIGLIIRHGVTFSGIMTLGLSFFFLSRAFSEVDVFFPYTIGTILFYSTYCRLMSIKKA